MICNSIIQAILLLGIIIAAIYCGKLLAVYKAKYPLEYSNLRKSVIGREQTINILLKILISQDTTNDNEILKTFREGAEELGKILLEMDGGVNP